ncbi:MAG: serine/threonine-protein kinase, partial [Planctomycetia bacterium]
MASKLDESIARILVADQRLSRAEAQELLSEVDGGAAPGLSQLLIERNKIDAATAEKAKEKAEKVANAPEIPGYVIISKLGEGGMGAVFKAEQESMQRIVALKILAPHLSSNSQFVDRFYREARASARIDHPNVVRGYDVGAAGNIHYFAMEFVDGTSVQNLIDERKTLSLGDGLKITRDVAIALIHAQELKMVHRDIKPDNIMVTKKGIVKLADLGLAKQTDE